MQEDIKTAVLVTSLLALFYIIILYIGSISTPDKLCNKIYSGSTYNSNENTCEKIERKDLLSK